MAGVIDLDAPIIPGVSAGGIALGSRIEDVLRLTDNYFSLKERPPGFLPIADWCARYELPASMYSTVYTSAAIDLWVKNSVVDQIGVHGEYRGKLRSVVGIGSTLADIEHQIGAWAEDDDGNLVVLGRPGLCFDMDALPPGTPQESTPDLRHAPISWFFVFAPEA